MNTPAIFLVDNGSLRPAATFALRELASVLCRKTGTAIEAVSLLHSHKIPSQQLGGQAATIVKRRMRELIAAGQREFVILPLFLGPSLAITEYLPEIADELRQDCADLVVKSLRQSPVATWSTRMCAWRACSPITYKHISRTGVTTRLLWLTTAPPSNR